jgi:hypothetical protein
MSEIKVNKVSSRTGNAVTLGSSGDTFTIPSGVTLTNSGTATGFGSVDWQSVVTSNTTMVAGRGYFVDTSGGAVTMTLPASPSLGDTVAVSALDGGTNAVTIARNSSNIEGATDDLTIASDYGAVTLVYSDAANGWYRHNNEAPDTFVEATGGTTSTTGNYKIHTFNSSGNFVVSTTSGKPVNNIVSYVVVGGGGGGGSSRGGGGGAGGFREGRASHDSYTASPLNAPAGLTVAQQTYPITVGAGGNGEPGPTNGGAGSQGSSSVFSTITSAGGGGGRDDDSPKPSNPGTNGGSGGGAGGGAAPQNVGGDGNTPPVSPPQGNNGGTANFSDGNGNQGAGGGGAGAVGTNQQPGSTVAPGGAGVASVITGSSVTRAGGAGAGSVPGKAVGAGGAGGGGNGNAAGTANTGGGGGGGPGPGTNGGASGGSGVVIIRYKYQ